MHLHHISIPLLLSAVLLVALPTLAQDSTPEPTADVTLEVEGEVTTEATVETDTANGLLIPIGGGYTDTFPGFLEAALPYVETLDTDRFYILMMPMSFTYDVEVLTTHDLLDNTYFIERRRNQLEAACETLMDERDLALDCQVWVPTVYTRDAAEDELVLDFFTDDLGAVYFVGGDQTFAMQILNNTVLEMALTEAFARGVPMGGNSAGAAMVAYNMGAGYTSEDFDVEDSFREGALALWTTDDERGLRFGLQNALIEQHTFQYARLGRMLHFLVLPNVDIPRVGIGVDGYAGIVVENDQIVRDPFGLYTVAILDAESLGAAENAEYIDGFLSVRNVVFHLFTAGDTASYDLLTRRVPTTDLPSIPDGTGERFVSSFTAPEEAGRLTLVGGDTPSLVPPFADAPGIVLVFGDMDASRYSRFGTLTPTEGSDMPDLADYPFITIVANDQSILTGEMLAPVREAWLAGANVTLVDAAVAAAGTSFVQQPSIDYDNDDATTLEAQEQGALLAGGVTLADGAAFLPLVIEPRLIDNNRWARLVALGEYAAMGSLALGIPADAAVAITQDGATVIGDNSIVVFDFIGSSSLYPPGESNSVVNGRIHVYAPSETISAE